MTTTLRTSFLAALLTSFVVLTPSFVHAQPPPPATPGSHPTAVPPTKAPAKPLPAATLPDGSGGVVATPLASTSTTPSSTTSDDDTSSTENGTMLYVLIGVGILALVGTARFLISRKNNPVPPQMTGM